MPQAIRLPASSLTSAPADRSPPATDSDWQPFAQAPCHQPFPYYAVSLQTFCTGDSENIFGIPDGQAACSRQGPIRVAPRDGRCKGRSLTADRICKSGEARMQNFEFRQQFIPSTPHSAYGLPHEIEAALAACWPIRSGHDLGHRVAKMASRCQASRRQVPCERSCSLQCGQAVFPAVGLAHRIHGEALMPPLVRPGTLRCFSGCIELCTTSLRHEALYVMSSSPCHVCLRVPCVSCCYQTCRLHSHFPSITTTFCIRAGNLASLQRACCERPDSCLRSRCTRLEGTRTMWRPPGWSLAQKSTRQLNQPQPKRRLPSSQASMQPRSARRSATALAWA